MCAVLPAPSRALESRFPSAKISDSKTEATPSPMGEGVASVVFTGYTLFRARLLRTASPDPYVSAGASISSTAFTVPVRQLYQK